MVTLSAPNGGADLCMQATGGTRPAVETVFGVYWFNGAAVTGTSEGIYCHKQVSAGDRSAYWYGSNSWYSGYNDYFGHSNGQPLNLSRHIIATEHDGESSWFDIDGYRTFGGTTPPRLSASTGVAWSSPMR